MSTPDYEGHGQCIEPACFGTDHRYEAITDDEDNGIGSAYTCLRCGSLDVRFSDSYRKLVLSGFDVEEPTDSETNTFWFKVDEFGEVVEITEEEFLGEDDDE